MIISFAVVNNVWAIYGESGGKYMYNSIQIVALMEDRDDPGDVHRYFEYFDSDIGGSITPAAGAENFVRFVFGNESDAVAVIKELEGTP